jgi:hypothetical protein
MLSFFKIVFFLVQLEPKRSVFFLPGVSSVLPRASYRGLVTKQKRAVEAAVSAAKATQATRPFGLAPGGFFGNIRFAKSENYC